MGGPAVFARYGVSPRRFFAAVKRSSRGRGSPGGVRVAPVVRRVQGLALRILAALFLVLASLPLSVLVPPTTPLAPGPAEAMHSITDFNPKSGPPGTEVTITGLGFLTTTIMMVTFGGGASASFTVVDDGTITTIVPTGATTGPITVSGMEPTDIQSTTSDFTVTAAGPTKLAITAITPSSPTAGQSFDVMVEAQDDAGNPTNVDLATNINLFVQTGTGSLGGTFTGSIAPATSSATISGVTYSIAETGVVLRADDDTIPNEAIETGLQPGDSAPFNVVASGGGTTPSAKSMTPVSGDGQTGGTTLPLRDPFVVQVNDASGPVTGHPVSWSIVSAPAGATGQALEILDTTTNGDGKAAVRFTLGDKPGSYTVAARSDLNGDGDTLDTGEEVQFTASAVSVLIRLSPETLRTNIDAGPMDVAIRVEAGQLLDGVQVRLTYGIENLQVVDGDENATNGVQLVPGPDFGQVLQNRVDPTTGVIEFAAGRGASQPAPSGSILLATIKLQGLMEGTHPLIFDATGVEVSYQGQVVTATLRDGQVEVSNYRLVFTAQPVRGAAGFALGVQPVVAVKDIQGNTRTSDNTTVVTLALNGPLGSLLTCAQTVEGVTSAVVVNGVAVFAGCTVNQPGGSYALEATAVGLAPAMTAPFNITLAGDTNADGRVSVTDFSLIVTHFGKTNTHPAWTNPDIMAFRADLNGDRRVSIVDFSIVVSRFGSTGAAVAASNGNPFPTP
ncbi:MAG: IPT/TIG domain-containing protein [Chloroflexi bacterium]|nr:IPT/TIG domain-containing protein [Chloroflexota bacterium]